MLETELRELESRAGQAQEEVADLAVEAKSKDGLIRLTLGSHGRLHTLTVDPHVKRLDVDVLAERIVETPPERSPRTTRARASRPSATSGRRTSRLLRRRPARRRSSPPTAAA